MIRPVIAALFIAGPAFAQTAEPVSSDSGFNLKLPADAAQGQPSSGFNLSYPATGEADEDGFRLDGVETPRQTDADQAEPTETDDLIRLDPK